MNLALGMMAVDKVREELGLPVVTLVCMFQRVTVGLLDADVYGPSIPCLLNLSHQPELSNRQ